MSDTPKKKTAKKTVTKAGLHGAVEVPADGRHWTSRVQPPDVEALSTTLTPEEVTELGDRLKNEATLIGQARFLRVRRSRTEIPKMAVGRKVLKPVEPGEVVKREMPDAPQPSGVKTVDSIGINTSRVVLPWTITEEFISDNPQKGSVGGLIADMMVTQLANDTEDLAINGDEAAKNDPLLCGNDGWLKLARENGHLVTAGASGDKALSFNDLERALRVMPLKYRRSARNLRFYVSYGGELDLRLAMQIRSAGAMPDGPLEYNGIPIVPVVYFPDNTVLLSDPDNLVFALQDKVKVRASWGGATAIMRDERYLAMHLRIDFAIQNTDAVVLLERIVVPPAPSLIHRLRTKLANLIAPR